MDVSNIPPHLPFLPISILEQSPITSQLKRIAAVCFADSLILLWLMGCVLSIVFGVSL
jgi:hypothetical protein